MTATLTELPDVALLLARGPQAVDLLQAQFTQELRDWPDGSARMAAMCTPQGRVLSDFLLWREGDGTIAMLLQRELQQPIAKRLRMFILRLRCTVEEPAAPRRVRGLLEPAGSPALLPELAAGPWQVLARPGLTCLRLPDAAGLRRTLLVESADSAAPLPAALAGCPAGRVQDWLLAGVRSGIAHVGSATSERFVPQMLNYDLLGLVDFKKGCYPGQEVVARTQYRGQVKRRLFRVLGAVPMAAGDEIYASADASQPCGMVVNAAPAEDGGWEALAELRLQAQGELRLRGADGEPLRLGTLPYALPAEA